MMVKSLTGIELGGADTTPPGTPTLELVDAGSEVKVQFEFTCWLAAGVYFMNAGVVADVEGRRPTFTG